MKMLFVNLWTRLVAHFVTKRTPATTTATVIPVRFASNEPTILGPETIITRTNPDGTAKKVLYWSRTTARLLSAKVVEYDQTTDRFKLARRAHSIYRRAHQHRPVTA